MIKPIEKSRGVSVYMFASCVIIACNMATCIQESLAPTAYDHRQWIPTLKDKLSYPPPSLRKYSLSLTWLIQAPVISENPVSGHRRTAFTFSPVPNCILFFYIRNLSTHIALKVEFHSWRWMSPRKQPRTWRRGSRIRMKRAMTTPDVLSNLLDNNSAVTSFTLHKFYVADNTRVTIHFIRWRVKIILKRERDTLSVKK